MAVSNCRIFKGIYLVIKRPNKVKVFRLINNKKNKGVVSNKSEAGFSQS